jgi:hypothetical protein
METPFVKPPIESQEGKIIPISIDSLRNPAVSMDSNKSGEYSNFIYEAQGLLQKIQEAGFWSPQQAEDYAKGYPNLNNALEVMRRNTLTKNIVEDRPMDMTWSYGEKGGEIYSRLDSLLQIEQLGSESLKDKEATDRTTAKLHELFVDTPDIEVGFEKVYEGFYRIRFTRTLEEGDFSFYVNIDSREKSVALLSYILPTEILYAFEGLKNASPLLKDLLENHPRLTIKLPPGIKDRIRERREKERKYREEIERLSATKEINPTVEVFEPGVYVRQGQSKVIPAEKGPIGTNGVGPCVVVCYKGRNQKKELILGLAHIEATQDVKRVLQEQEEALVKNGVLPGEIERFLVGGWRSTEELQKRLIGLSKEFPIKGVKINIKNEGLEYPENKNYIDVVITPAGDILYGENGEIFKVQR